MIPAQIGDTSGVHGILRSLAIVAVAGALSASCQTPASAWQIAVDRAAHQSPNAINLDARIIVLDLATGRLLASHQLADASRTVAAPGSTLKPLVLYSLIRAGRWNSSQAVWPATGNSSWPAIAWRARTHSRRPSTPAKRSPGRATVISPRWRAASSPVS